MKVVYNSNLTHTCGVGLLGYFSSDTWNISPHNNSKTITPYGGADWACAGFIDDEVRKEVYEDFKARWPIVFQTVKRRNNNSGNSFIFVVYDTKKPRKSKNSPEGKVDLSGNVKYKWPWQ